MNLSVPFTNQTDALAIGLLCSSLLCGTAFFYPSLYKQFITSAYLLTRPREEPHKQRII